MSKLSIHRSGNKFVLDEFYKSLMFQHIMDEGFSRNERDVLLVIFRKTLHFEKWSDSIGIYWLSKASGIGPQTLRKVITQLELKGIIHIIRSNGGRSSSTKKFHTFSISNNFVNLIFNIWLGIKEDNNFMV